MLTFFFLSYRFKLLNTVHSCSMTGMILGKGYRRGGGGGGGQGGEDFGRQILFV